MRPHHLLDGKPCKLFENFQSACPLKSRNTHKKSHGKSIGLFVTGKYILYLIGQLFFSQGIHGNSTFSFCNYDWPLSNCRLLISLQNLPRDFPNSRITQIYI